MSLIASRGWRLRGFVGALGRVALALCLVGYACGCGTSGGYPFLPGGGYYVDDANTATR